MLTFFRLVAAAGVLVAGLAEAWDSDKWWWWWTTGLLVAGLAVGAASGTPIARWESGQETGAVAALRAAQRTKGAPMAKYTAIIEAEGDRWVVSVPALPGCFTEGSTRAEAREMAVDAIREWLLSCQADGEPFPKNRASRRPGAERLTIDIG